MRHAFDVAQPEGQEGLGALQGLGLALLIDAQHQGMVGRIQVEADDVADLLDEEGIGGELEVLPPMGLEVERGPEALDRGLGAPGVLGHGTTGPVCATVALSRPSAHSRTISARRTRPAGRLRDRASASSSSRVS